MYVKAYSQIRNIWKKKGDKGIFEAIHKERYKMKILM